MSRLLKVCLAVALLTPGPVLHAQSSTRSARELLEAFVREESPSVTYGEADRAISLIMYQTGEYPRPLVDSLLVGLEELALNDPREHVRVLAVSRLSSPGLRILPKPNSGTVGRLLRIYRRSDNPRVRSVILGFMSAQAERREALAFVRAIAIQEREDFPNAVHEAIRTLVLGMGDEGRAVVRELHEQNLVRDPEERANLAQLARHHGWAEVKP